ncbi:hypothetical protein Tco_0377371 [Tanacetum coccineum]
MSFKTYSNPLFDLDEEIISSEFNPIHNEDPDSTPKNDRFDAESYLLESLFNRDTLMASSPKVDSTLDKFAGELKTIPPGIVNREHEEYISMMESLFPHDSIPPGIESDDYDSEDDDNSTSFPEFESFHVDYPDLGDSTINVVEDIPVDVPNILPTHPTLHMDFDFIPSYNDLGSDLDVSSPSGDRNKIYDPGICIEVDPRDFLLLFPLCLTALLLSCIEPSSVFRRLTVKIGIRASDMSNSDELRHTDNTTLVPPRLPDTLPQVYHRRRPTLGLLILPSVSPFPPTIRRTARISIPPIEPNLAERARISAINLDDYQLDPVTPPPSPSSPFTMAAYQRMIAETDPTQREEALTETGQNSVPELEAFMTLWDVKPRVEESSLETLSMDELITQLRQLCEDAEDRASNAQEEARQKRKEALEEVIQRIYHNNN